MIRACLGTSFIVWTCVFCCKKCSIVLQNWNGDWNNLCWSLCHAYCIDHNHHTQSSIRLWCMKTADHPHNQVNSCPLNNTSSSSIWNLFTPHTLSYVLPFWPPVGLRAHLRPSRPNQIQAWVEEGDILTADCWTALDGIDEFQERQARRTSCNLFVYMHNRPYNTAHWRALSMFQWYYFLVRFLLLCLLLTSVSVGTSKYIISLIWCVILYKIHLVPDWGAGPPKDQKKCQVLAIFPQYNQHYWWQPHPHCTPGTLAWSVLQQERVPFPECTLYLQLRPQLYIFTHWMGGICNERTRVWWCDLNWSAHSPRKILAGQWWLPSSTTTPCSILQHLLLSCRVGSGKSKVHYLLFCIIC